MRTKLNIHYRPFTSHKERRDAGYYTDLDEGKKAKIEVDICESAVEQILTMYHEFSHHVFDFLCQYEFDPENRKIVKREDVDQVKDDWKSLVETRQFRGKPTTETREEIICLKIERAVKRILKKEVPQEFKKIFFEKP